MPEGIHASPPSAELYKALSIECFYDYLRFEAFQNFTESKRKELILIALKVPLKKDDVINTLFSYIHEQNLESAMEYLKMREVKDLPSTGKNMEAMIDAYFKESDRYRALKFLRFLMYFPPKQTEAYETFLKSYIHAKPDARNTMLPTVMYNAFTL